MYHPKHCAAFFLVSIMVVWHPVGQAQEPLLPGIPALTSKTLSDLAMVISMGSAIWSGVNYRKDVTNLNITTLVPPCDSDCQSGIDRFKAMGSTMERLSIAGTAASAASLILDIVGGLLVFDQNPAGLYVFRASFVGTLSAFIIGGVQNSMLASIPNSIPASTAPRVVLKQLQNILPANLVTLYAGTASAGTLVTHLYTSSITAKANAIALQAKGMSAFISSIQQDAPYIAWLSGLASHATDPIGAGALADAATSLSSAEATAILSAWHSQPLRADF